MIVIISKKRHEQNHLIYIYIFTNKADLPFFTYLCSASNSTIAPRTRPRFPKSRSKRPWKPNPPPTNTLSTVVSRKQLVQVIITHGWKRWKRRQPGHGGSGGGGSSIRGFREIIQKEMQSCGEEAASQVLHYPALHSYACVLAWAERHLSGKRKPTVYLYLFI